MGELGIVTYWHINISQQPKRRTAQDSRLAHKHQVLEKNWEFTHPEMVLVHLLKYLSIWLLDHWNIERQNDPRILSCTPVGFMQSERVGQLGGLNDE
ncbi:hypothetical protein MTR_7g064170 [Medicago truncatula]|uniref:Uncharacterized protein n=1 Tax=Medicago truncatula TaxID=3880 RepID=A0A072U081_MEDTR|nr:hypothetical protein MTR_7g064170 [Medicago truncatula]